MLHISEGLPPELQPDTQPKTLSEDGPPAGVVFGVPPPAPQRTDASKTTAFTGPLSHSNALRRACLDPYLASQTIDSKWVEQDDPTNQSKLVICGTSLLIPLRFEEHCVLTAFARDLDRVEAKFRAGRKDKSIGGELGSIIIKKRVQKGRKISIKGINDFGINGAGKRPLSGASQNERNTKRIKEELPKKKIDYTLHYRIAVKGSDISKASRARSLSIAAQMQGAKRVAWACVKESRKLAFRSVRVIDEAHKRARRILKDVLSYWKKEDKERQEERKKLMARAEEHRKQEADEREAQRQKNKLKFLLGQSEAFSSFLKAKTKATAEADSLERSSQSAKGGKAKDMDGITGAENDDDLRRMYEAKAAQAVKQHQERIKKFDVETQKRKDVAKEASQKAAANMAAAKKMKDMDDATRAEIEAIDNDHEKHHANGSSSKETQRLAGGEKPEVAAVRQPTILDCKMKDYQLRGLAWLVSLYDQGINGILADEMGLGKTLQTISFLAYLAEKEDNWGPFLVVSPKATLHNWQQEVTKFCKPLKVLPYWGNKNERNELRKYWSHKRMYRRDSEFQVCITSYEILTVDEKYFHRVKWQYLVLDEAQAIKNSNSTRWRALLQFPCRNRLLLTGTPLQNKLSELWSLLHFIMPTIFDSHAEFADWFAKDIEGHAQNNRILDATTLSRLRTLLDPFMLRRVKRDVESEMPPKTEVQLGCTLSPRQRQLYASIKADISPEELSRALGTNGGNQGQDISDRNSKLMNLVMQLRKVCNHPETFERRVPQSPYQFQATPPPSHVAPPPSVLVASNEAVAPLDITLISRSQLEIVAPRCILDIIKQNNSLTNLARSLYGIWSRERLRNRMYESLSPLSVLRLSGGMSISDVHSAVVQDKRTWCWRKFGVSTDEDLVRREEMYATNFATIDDEKESKNLLKNSHRLLLEPRAKMLSRQKAQVILPGHESPADMIVHSTRLLKSGQVYIPKTWAPVPDLYLPGEASRAEDLQIGASLPYPDFPYEGEQRNTEDVYDVFRCLDAQYGAHIGTAPIQMPEAGRLIADCGKMKVLDPLLRRLKTEGHKCLIYSQFTRVLDILEDYCGKSGYKFVRLDGQSALADRRDIVAEWQTNDELFIFLLSTRAGGVGLNLTAADTVIFFDSDWNPTQDLQAMDRAHRLGQERPVTVYRLISRGTIEERMLKRAQQKSRVNDLVIKGGGLNTEVEDNNKNDEAEIDDIAALLMGEEEFNATLDVDELLSIARKAVSLTQNGS